MNISNMSSDFVSTLFGSSNSAGRGSFGFDPSLYTDFRSFKPSTFRGLLDGAGFTSTTKTNQTYKNQSSKTQVNSFAAAELKSSAGSLKSAAASLSGVGSDSVFKKYQAASSDTNAIEKAYADGALTSMKKTTQVNVKQTAQSQQNTGTTLNSSEQALVHGSYSFEIETGGKKTSLSFTVSRTDTNLTMQQKLVSAINKADLGITAKVNTANSQSFITVEANETGKEALGRDKVFSISDKYGGTAISSLGLNNTTREAQNAVYSVDNGIDRTSRSNTVDLGGGAKAVLKNVSDGNVTLNFTNDRSAITSAVKNFVNEFNDALDTTSYYGNNSRNINSLNSSLSSMSQSNRYALSSVGISVDSKGHLSVDDEKFKKADINKIKSIFSSNGSFADTVNKKAANIYSNANRYATESYGSYGTQNRPYSSAFSGGIYNNWF